MPFALKPGKPAPFQALRLHPPMRKRLDKGDFKSAVSTNFTTQAMVATILGIKSPEKGTHYSSDCAFNQQIIELRIKFFRHTAYIEQHYSLLEFRLVPPQTNSIFIGFSENDILKISIDENFSTKKISLNTLKCLYAHIGK